MVGAEIAETGNGSDDPVEHPTHGDAVWITRVRGEADDPAGELIHHEHDPMARTEKQGAYAKNKSLSG